MGEGEDRCAVVVDGRAKDDHRGRRRTLLANRSPSIRGRWNHIRRAFRLKQLKVIGTAVPVLQGVQRLIGSGVAHLNVSSTALKNTPQGLICGVSRTDGG